MNKSTKKPIPTKVNAKQADIFDIPESIIPVNKRLFTPNWNNRPPLLPTVITVQGKSVLSTGNLMVIVSPPGTGKTSICEGIMAALVNPDCDGLGFKVTLSRPRDKVLYIDTEQEKIDHWDSWARTYKRAGIKEPNINHRIIFESFKSIAFADRKATVEQLLNDNPDIGLIIFDGAGDFIKDTNSVPDTNEFTEWINTFNPRISKIVTIHTNPRDNKPRGHAGSELCRRGYSVFLLRKVDGGLAREMTTEFEYGKVRRDDDRISLFFEFSKDLQMFVSAEDYVPEKSALRREKEEGYREVAKQVFSNGSECSFSSIIDKISQICNLQKTGAKAYFTRHFIKGKLVEKTTGGYRLQN